MRRSIKTLFLFEPPASDNEICVAALQFVRKISGATKPSKKNEAAWDAAVAEIFAASKKLFYGMVRTGPLKDRDTEVAKARARSALRFAKTDAPPKARLLP